MNAPAEKIIEPTQREQDLARYRAEATVLYNALVPLDLEPAEAYLREHPPSLGALAFLPFLWEEYTTGERSRRFIEEVQRKGAQENKARAADRRANWRRINADLLRDRHDLDTPDKRADYIRRQPDHGKMRNGKPYSLRTIKAAIKGVR